MSGRECGSVQPGAHGTWGGSLGVVCEAGSGPQEAGAQAEGRARGAVVYSSEFSGHEVK